MTVAAGAESKVATTKRATPVKNRPTGITLKVGEAYDVADALRIAAGVYEAQAHRRDLDTHSCRRLDQDEDCLKRAKRCRALADRIIS